MQLKLILLLIILQACSGNEKNVVEGTRKANYSVGLSLNQYKNADIRLGVIEHIPLSSIIKVSGRIDIPPQNMVSVSVPLGGRLLSTKLLPGLHVAKGEVIAILEDQQYIQIQQDYLASKANLDFIEKEYFRQKELNASKASSDKIYERARADYLTQNIMISALAEKLKLIGIEPSRLNESTISRTIRMYSPIKGFVSKVNSNIGKYVTPSDILFELIDPEDIHLNMMIFEKDIDKLYIGQKVMTYTNTNPEKKYECEVMMIGKALSVQRYIEVHCHFKDYEKSLIPGMYMNAEIEVKSNQVPVLPEDALVQFEGKIYVFLESGNMQYSMKEVLIGSKSSGKVEIKNPAEFENRRIVTNGAYTLLTMLENDMK